MHPGVSDHSRLSEVQTKQILRVGWLIDGQGGSIAPDQIMVIDQGRIQSIQPYHPSLSPDGDLLDLTGATVMPALMDAHVHLALSGTLDAVRRKAQLEQTPLQAETLIKSNLQDHLDCGVISVRDGGDSLGQVLKFKAEQKTPIHLAATCWAWHAPGRYGAMIGRTPAPGEALDKAVSDFAQGLDHIKLIQSGINSLDRYGLQTAPQFSETALRAVKRFAETRRLPVMVHANGRDPVGIALAAGCDSIEHGYFMGPDNLQCMAERQVYWVPTVIPMASLTRDGLLSPERTDVARRTLEQQLKQIAGALQAGVRIALGTDAGSMGVDHGAAVRQELALLMDAGMSLARAVECAALNAARLMGFKDRGALKAGMRADLIAVHGRPELLPASLEHISGLCIGGRWRTKNL